MLKQKNILITDQHKTLPVSLCQAMSQEFHTCLNQINHISLILLRASFTHNLSYFLQDFILLDDSSIASKREQPPKSSLTFSRLFAIAALMAQQQYDPTGIAM